MVVMVPKQSAATDSVAIARRQRLSRYASHSSPANSAGYTKMTVSEKKKLSHATPSKRPNVRGVRFSRQRR
jgi:hypothetical protein